MGIPLSLLVLLITLTLVSATLSCMEAAFIALNKIRLAHLREKKIRGAERVYQLTSRLDELITTVVIGNNILNIAIASISTAIFVRYFGEKMGVLLSTVAVAAVILVVAEITPKIFATNHPEIVVFTLRHFMQFLMFLFKPFVVIATLISNALIKLVGGKPGYRMPLVSEEEIKLMIRVGKEEGYYGDNERKMLERIFHFDDTEVKDVMTPSDKMFSIDVNIPENDLANLLMEEGHNRIPVYEGDPNNIIGILYVHDLLYYIKNNELIHMKDLLSAPYFVPPEKKLSALLREFQQRKIQIALVRSPQNKVLGLATLEDLVEEIVGEIKEEPQ